ncbi:hypothetical protein BU17DRAFT_62099 [Hysterangium stoloniferum]|nr:hypothetical protein BU17DRAFT_62099 [Hysterangium stoloniferum]
MMPNETSHRKSSLFRSCSFIFKRRISNENLRSPEECDETSEINSYPPDKDESRPLRRPSSHPQLQPRPMKIGIPPNTSPDITQNWLTATPIPNAAASPRFSRAGVEGVVMPAKVNGPRTLVEAPEGFGQAVFIYQCGKESGGGEDGVLPLKEPETEPKQLSPLQRVISTHSQMQRGGQKPSPSEGDDGQSRGRGRRLVIFSALRRWFNLGDSWSN